MESTDATFTIRLSPVLKRRLRIAAAYRGEDMSSLARAILESGIGKAERDIRESDTTTPAHEAA